MIVRGGSNMKISLNIRYIAIVAVSCIVLSSCATFYNDYSYNNRVSHPTYLKCILYMPNRIFDLLDIFRLNVGVGPGIGVNLRATQFAQVGIASYDAIKLGIIGRQGWIYMEESKEFGVSLLYIEDSKAVGPLIAFEEKTDRQLLGIGGFLYLFFVGVEAGIRPKEIADFFLGWAMIDFVEDDF